MTDITFLWRHSLLQMFHTGNPILDIVVGSAILGLITYIASKPYLLTEYPEKIWRACCYICRRIIYLFRNKDEKLVYRERTIDYYTETKSVNELFKAVYWYLTFKVDLSLEDYIKYTYEKAINLNEKKNELTDANINKILPSGYTKTFSFMNYNLTYKFQTNIMTVYQDKERRKENYQIIISGYVSKNDTRDIFELFVQECMLDYAKNLKSQKWEQKIYVNKNGNWDAIYSDNKRSLDTIILRNGLKEYLIEDTKNFLNSEKWYADRDIPYTRGYMLYGHTGTGKTSYIKAISLYCKRHIHYLMLNEVKSDTELINLLKNVNFAETILVIEDVDCYGEIVKKRNNNILDDTKKVIVKKDDDTVPIIKDNKDITATLTKTNKPKEEPIPGVSMTALLNALSGVFSAHGRILFMTTNHLEVLDEALIRPGRIDVSLEFKKCDQDQISRLYTNFFGKESDKDKIMKIKDDIFSPAEVTSVFIKYRYNYEKKDPLNELI